MKNEIVTSAGKGGGPRSRSDELLSYAARALNARGVSQTSLGQIADDLGISRAALYYYVDDLQDLVFQCYRGTCETLSVQLANAVRGGGDEAAVISRFISDALGGAEFASLNEIGYLNDAQRETILGLYDGLLAQLAGVIAKGKSAGRLRSCDAWIVAHTIISMIFWVPIAEGWSPGARAISHATSADALSDLVLYGIQADGAPSEVRHPVTFSTLLPSSKGLFDKEYLTLARREALMLAASHLFNRKGVDATSLEEIAASVGATKRAILHYFGDKHGLVEAAYKRAYAIYLLVPRTLAESGLGPIGRLASAWVALSSAYLRDDISPLTPRVGVDAFREDVRHDIELLSTQLTAEYAAILDEARTAGLLRDFDDGGFLLVVSGAFAWLTRGIFSAEIEDHARIAEEIADLLMIGLSRRE